MSISSLILDRYAEAYKQAICIIPYCVVCEKVLDDSRANLVVCGSLCKQTLADCQQVALLDSTGFTPKRTI